jgi:hypothetical protein
VQRQQSGNVFGLLLQICRQVSRGNAVNASRSSRASSRCLAAAGKLRLDGGHHPVELGADGVGLWLIKQGADQGGHPRLGSLGNLCRQVRW